MSKTLKQHRVENMFTVRSLAAAGVSSATVFRVERGRVRPNFGTMVAISNALGLEDVRDVAEFANALEKMAEAA